MGTPFAPCTKPHSQLGGHVPEGVKQVFCAVQVWPFGHVPQRIDPPQPLSAQPHSAPAGHAFLRWQQVWSFMHTSPSAQFPHSMLCPQPSGTVPHEWGGHVVSGVQPLKHSHPHAVAHRTMLFAWPIPDASHNLFSISGVLADAESQA
jgi:hypothetical protein